MEDEAIAAVLAGVTTIEGVSGDALPGELADTPTLSSWVAEGAAASFIPTPRLPTWATALKPNVSRGRPRPTRLQAAIMGGARFEQALDLHLRASPCGSRDARRSDRKRRELISQRGVTSTTGVMATDVHLRRQGET